MNCLCLLMVYLCVLVMWVWCMNCVGDVDYFWLTVIVHGCWWFCLNFLYLVLYGDWLWCWWMCLINLIGFVYVCIAVFFVKSMFLVFLCSCLFFCLLFTGLLWFSLVLLITIVCFTGSIVARWHWHKILLLSVFVVDSVIMCYD